MTLMSDRRNYWGNKLILTSVNIDNTTRRNITEDKRLQYVLFIN
jgi:hypothetical protein